MSLTFDKNSFSAGKAITDDYTFTQFGVAPRIDFSSGTSIRPSITNTHVHINDSGRSVNIQSYGVGVSQNLGSGWTGSASVDSHGNFGVGIFGSW